MIRFAALIGCLALVGCAEEQDFGPPPNVPQALADSQRVQQDQVKSLQDQAGKSQENLWKALQSAQAARVADPPANPYAAPVASAPAWAAPPANPPAIMGPMPVVQDTTWKICFFAHSALELDTAIKREYANPSGVIHLAKLNDWGQQLQQQKIYLTQLSKDFQAEKGRKFTRQDCDGVEISQ
jgi:hypothetical protein